MAPADPPDSRKIEFNVRRSNAYVVTLPWARESEQAHRAAGKGRPDSGLTAFPAYQVAEMRKILASPARGQAS
jgi:hypothetical protein